MKEEDFRLFGDLVRAKSGIELPPIRRSEIERLIRKVLTETGLDDPRALHRRFSAAENNYEFEEFVGALTIGETYFFRNRPQITALQKTVFPQVIEQRRQLRSLRVWSAGCATGEEPYSIAILLERLLHDLDAWRVSILGTDVSRAALKKATAGIYGPWSFRNVDPEVKQRYFTEANGVFEIEARIRDRVTFGYLNLVEDPYPALATNTYSMDVILCRNVLIYFNDETRSRIVARFHDALVDGGWLIVGHAEPSRDLFSAYETHNFPGATLYRKSEIVSYLPRIVELGPPAPVVGQLPVEQVEAGPPSLKPPPQNQVGEPASTPQQIALELWAAGHSEEALKALARISDSDPSDARSPYLAAKLCADRRELESALLWVGVSLTRDPLLAPAHYMRALILEEEGDLEGALRSVRSCLYADATWPLGHFALGVLFQRMGRNQRAAKAFDYALRILVETDPDEVIADSDGVTAGQLRHLADAHRELMGGVPSEPSLDPRSSQEAASG